MLDQPVDYTEQKLARQALRDAEAALDEAEHLGEPAKLTLALATVAQRHRQLGALAEAVWYAKRGLAVALGLPGVDASIDAMCALAELSVERAARLEGNDEPRAVHRLHEAARDYAYSASQAAQHCADADWEMSVLIRVSGVLDSVGDHDDAIQMQKRVIQLISERLTA